MKTNSCIDGNFVVTDGGPEDVVMTTSDAILQWRLIWNFHYTHGVHFTASLPSIMHSVGPLWFVLIELRLILSFFLELPHLNDGGFDSGEANVKTMGKSITWTRKGNNTDTKSRGHIAGDIP